MTYILIKPTYLDTFQWNFSVVSQLKSWEIIH